MKAILICPAQRGNVASLAEYSPLSNVPILGATLIEYWLEHLVALKATRVLVSASDRPERVRELTGIGERWGLRLNSGGLAALLALREAAEKHGGGAIALRLVHPRHPVQRMLEVTRMHHFFEIVPFHAEVPV